MCHGVLHLFSIKVKIILEGNADENVSVFDSYSILQLEYFFFEHKL